MISGNVRTNSEKFTKKVGYFKSNVIAVNPDEQWLESKGIPIKEDSKITQYCGQKEDVRTLRITFYLEETLTQQIFSVSYYLEDRDKIKLDGSKKQFLNNKGSSTWADEESSLPLWFTKSDYRIAKVGEANLYSFLKSWLSKLDYTDPGVILNLNWNKLIDGDVREIQEQIDGVYSQPILTMSYIETKDGENGVVEYQKVYNGAVAPGYCYQILKNTDISEEFLERIKKENKPKAYEKFIKDIIDETYGCKHFYSLKPLHDYDPKENIVGKREISEENNDY